MTAILKVDTIQDTSGNNIINESSDTITIGASGDTTNIIGTLQNNGSALNFATVNGITMADQWRLSASTTFSSGVSNKISSNWERTDTTGYGTIGSAMTESSGEFSFPATGIYLLMFKMNGKSASSSNNRYVNGHIYTSTDGGSSVNIAARGAAGPAGNAWDFDTTAIFIFDVTSTSTHKVQFGYEFEQSTRVYGNTADSQTCVTFIRLGDT